MTKRLSDTSALTAQGIKEAGNEFASEKTPDWLDPNPLTPAYQSADYAVGAETRRKKREAMFNNPVPYVAPSERAENSRRTGAGNSALSNAVRICKE